MKLLMYFYSIIMSLFTSNKQELSFAGVPMDSPLKLDLQFFASEGGEGGDDGSDGGGDGSSDGKTFTQEELNQHVKDRVSRAEKSAQTALAKELGYESVEAMQEALKKPEDKPKPEVKPGDPVDVDALIEEKLKAERAKTFTRVLNSEVKVVANELGFVDHGDALALADLSDVKENEKGDLEGVKEALEALAKAKPHLVKQASGTNFGSDINNKPKDNKEHFENIAKLAQNRGTHAPVENDPWKR